MKVFEYILLLLALCIPVSCTESSDSASPSVLDNTDIDTLLELQAKNPADNDLNLSIWKYYTEQGQWDNLVNNARPVFWRNFQNEENEGLWLNSGAFLAQAFIFKEEFDSVAVYLDPLTDFIDREDVAYLPKIMLCNTAAIYSIKTELNYSNALVLYEKARKLAAEHEDIANECVMLCNIASIYYNMNDAAGLKYALEAYEKNKSLESSTSLYSITLSAILVAQMYCLEGDAANALLYTDEAFSNSSHFPQFLSSIYLLYAEICAMKLDYSQSETYFSRALANKQYSDPGTNSDIYLKYGRMLAKTGEYEQAVSVLRRGLMISDSTGNIEYRHKLLYELSETAYSLGNKDDALEYYKLYHVQTDSVSHIQKERAFAKYLLLQKQHEVQGKELELERSNQRTFIISALGLVVVIISVFLYVLNRRRNKAYRQLVEAHQQYMTRTATLKNTIREEAEMSKDESSDLELWKKTEQLMDSEKVFRMNDISMEKLAKMLQSNRTYLSRAINKYSGNTFYGYINSKRIEEAISILTDENSQVPMKSLYVMLGYNSLTSFYRAFQKETGCPPSKYREEMLKMKKI